MNPAPRHRPVLLCLSHLRWDFVFQRPQHLLTQAAATYEVVFFEEPEPTTQPDDAPCLQVRRTKEGVLVATPLLPCGLDVLSAEASLRELLDKMLSDLGGAVAVTWYYTPMALAFAGHLRAGVVVYDCMDELTLFRGASPRLALLKRQLLKRADLVFTGGRSLHEAKRRFHPRTHLFPSSVDTAHFGRARSDAVADPADQAGLPQPRIGFFGVLDERIDFALVDSVAAARPEWQLVMLGPTAKIDPAALPRRANLGVVQDVLTPGYTGRRRSRLGKEIPRLERYPDLNHADLGEQDGAGHRAFLVGGGNRSVLRRGCRSERRTKIRQVAGTRWLVQQ